MKLTVADLNLLCDTAIAAAKAAGDVLAQYADRPLHVKRKTGGSLASTVVTEADLHSQRTVLSQLAPSIEQFNLAILSEEHPDDGSRFEKDYFWCVDPLDGTLPFIEGTPGYSVVISLISRTGIPQVGVVFDVAQETLYSAVVNQGCFRNGVLWHAATFDSYSGLSLAATFDRSTMEKEHFATVEKELQRLTTPIGFSSLNTLNYGGAAMNAMYILEHQPGCYFKFPRKTDSGGSIWDYGASVCIFKEWGGFVTDVFGEPLELNRKESTFLNHRGFVFASHKDIAQSILDTFMKSL